MPAYPAVSSACPASRPAQNSKCQKTPPAQINANRTPLSTTDEQMHATARCKAIFFMQVLKNGRIFVWPRQPAVLNRSDGKVARKIEQHETTRGKCIGKYLPWGVLYVVNLIPPEGVNPSLFSISSAEFPGEGEKHRMRGNSGVGQQ